MGDKATTINSVLVVDNDPAVLTFMNMLLQREGYAVRTANDGLEALHLLREYDPHVIFIDLIMPNIGGKKLCQILRAKSQFDQTYLIVISAISSEEEIDYISFGFDACIAKGPLKKLGRHILDVLGMLGTKITRHSPGSTYGLEDLYRREITRELLSTKRHSELILNNMSESIVELTLDRQIVFANPQAVSLLDTPESQLLASDFVDIFDGDQRERVLATLEAANTEPIWITDEHPLKFRDKLLTASALPVEDDGQVSLVIIMSDVTYNKHAEEGLRQAHHDLEARVMERTRDLATANRSLQSEIGQRRELEQKLRTSLEEKETLLNEIHHRVKNNLQIFSSLLTIYSRKIGNPELDWILKEMRDRIHSISLVHEKLYRSANLAAVNIGDYLRSLLAHLVQSYAADTSKIKAEVVSEAVHLSIDQAVPCALVVNELVTNALKYAFPEGREGKITVSIQRPSGDTCRIQVSDDGVGLPKGVEVGNTGSLGLRIVKILTRQLDGRLGFGNKKGVPHTNRCTIYGALIE